MVRGSLTNLHIEERYGDRDKSEYSWQSPQQCHRLVRVVDKGVGEVGDSGYDPAHQECKDDVVRLRNVTMVRFFAPDVVTVH